MKQKKKLNSLDMGASSSVIALCASITAGLGGAAYAQEADAAPGDEVIVVGTKQGLTLQEADVSVEVFTEERLDRESLFTLNDIVQRTPNVNTTGLTSSVAIRGLQRSGISGSGQGVTSNVYLDRVPLASVALSFGIESLWDIGQVEVLRGPQSTVQGRNALAGAIVITSKDPTYEFEAAGRVRYSEFDTQQYSGVVSGPIIDDQLAARIAIDYQSSDGFIDNGVVPGDQNFSEALTVRGKLLAEPNFLPRLRAELIFEYSDGEVGVFTPLVVSPFDPVDEDPASLDFDFQDLVSFGETQVNRSETYRAVADLTYDLTDNLTLRGVGTFEDATRDSRLGNLDDVTIFPINGVNDDDTRTYSGELTLNYDFGRWSGFVGGYYFEDNQVISLDSVLALSVVNAIPFSILDPADSTLSSFVSNGSDVRNYAFYGQTRFEATDRLTLSFGIRYDNERFTTTGDNVEAGVVDPASCVVNNVATIFLPPEFIDVLAPGVPPAFLPPVFNGIPCQLAVGALAPAIALPPQTESFSAVLPRGSITYDITEDLSVFFSGQRGYRAGGAFVRLDESFAVVSDTFDPEFLTNFEIGFRSQWLERRLTVNGNIFYSRLNDQQISLPGATGNILDFDIVNAAKSTLYGLELSADYQVTDGLSLFGSLGLLETEFDDFPFAVNTPDSPFANLAGNELPFATNVQFTVGGSYEHSSGLFGDVSVNYSDGGFSDPENLTEEDFIAGYTELGIDPSFAAGLTNEFDSRTIVNLRIGYRHDRFTLFGFATNLFDERGALLRDNGSVTAATGAFSVNPGAEQVIKPQSFGVGLDFNL